MAFFSKVFRKIDPEKEKKLREDKEKEGGVDKKDIRAMIFSAYLVILLPVIGIFMLFSLVAWAFLGFK